MFPLRTQIAGILRSTASSGPRILVAAPRSRQIHASSQYRARKDDQDREAINTESNEYSKSEGDKEAADAIGDAAFSRDKTRPEQQLNTAERETKGASQQKRNPLDASPANKEISETPDKKQRV